MLAPDARLTLTRQAPPPPLDATVINIPDFDEDAPPAQSHSTKRNFLNLAVTGISVGPFVYYATERLDFAVIAVAMVALGFYIGCECPNATKDVAKILLQDSGENLRSFGNLTYNVGGQGFKITRATINSLNSRNTARLRILAHNIFRASHFLIRSVANRHTFHCMLETVKLGAQISYNGFRLIKAISNAARKIPNDIMQIPNHLAEGVGAIVSAIAKVASIAIKAPANLLSTPFDLVQKTAFLFPKVTGYIAMAVITYMLVMFQLYSTPLGA